MTNFHYCLKVSESWILFSLCICFLQSYHHWEGEGDDVDGPQRAEAGQDGQEQVVSRLGPVHSGFCDGTGLAGERGPGWARTNRAGPAAQTRPTVSVTARLGVKFGRHRGHCGRRVDPDRTDAVTWRRGSLQRRRILTQFLLLSARRQNSVCESDGQSEGIQTNLTGHLKTIIIFHAPYEIFKQK